MRRLSTSAERRAASQAHTRDSGTAQGLTSVARVSAGFSATAPVFARILPAGWRRMAGWRRTAGWQPDLSPRHSTNLRARPLVSRSRVFSLLTQSADVLSAREKPNAYLRIFVAAHI